MMKKLNYKNNIYHDKNENNDNNKLSKWRLIIFVLIVISIFLIMIIKSFQIQILNYDLYSNLDTSQHFKEYIINRKRGSIFLQDIKNQSYFPIAINKKKYDLIIDPSLLSKESSEYVNSVKQILFKKIPGIDPLKFDDQLSKSELKWQLVQKDIEEEVVNEINQKKLNGIYFEEKISRFYPEKNLASQVIGFVQKDNIGEGKYGVEGHFNNILKGENGFKKQETDITGNWLAFGESNNIDAVDGADIVLTIDHNIQYKLESTLQKLQDEFKPKYSMGLIMDPKTGDILAMATLPSFDPNNYNLVSDINIFSNPTISNLYEPGSIFKPFTAAIGLDTGAFSSETKFTDTGELTLNGFTIKNALEKKYGEQTMTNVLEKSINTGTVFMQQKAGKEAFVDYLSDKFNFPNKTNIDLPSEATSNISNITKSIRDSRDINYATASFGQGISMTPIRLLSSFNSFVNDGIIMKPQIVKEIKLSNGEVKKNEPIIESQALSKESSEELSKMLVSVVNNGHGSKAGVEGYNIGGKTGTAQIAIKGGYGEDTFQSFIEFVTLDDPKYTLLISLDSPKDVRFSDTSVVPATKELNEFLINYFEIIPESN